jgi:hypothetical protein
MKCAPLTRSLTLSTLLVAATQGQSIDPAAYDTAMFGFNRNTGELARFDLDIHEGQSIGLVQTGNGTVLQGINASAYIPGFQNIFAFWPDPDDGLSKLVYVNCETAHAVVMGNDTGFAGRIGGAVAVNFSDDASAWMLYAVEQSYIEDAAHDEHARREVSGSININPNNSDHSEFRLTKADGGIITRDDLHHDTEIDRDGVYYRGLASEFFVKPKGNGNQNGLIVDGQMYLLDNGRTYLITGDDMSVTLYNDHENHGRAMGHWWITVDSGQVSVHDSGEASYEEMVAQAAEQQVHAARLLRVNHKNPSDFETIMTLSHDYDGLAWCAGKGFYATSGQELYRLDPDASTETLVGQLSATSVFSLEFAGETLMGFEVQGQTLVPIDALTGQSLGQPAAVGMTDLGSIIFMPLELDLAAMSESYD